MYFILYFMLCSVLFCSVLHLQTILHCFTILSPAHTLLYCLVLIPPCSVCGTRRRKHLSCLISWFDLLERDQPLPLWDIAGFMLGTCMHLHASLLLKLEWWSLVANVWIVYVRTIVLYLSIPLTVCCFWLPRWLSGWAWIWNYCIDIEILCGKDLLHLAWLVAICMRYCCNKRMDKKAYVVDEDES